MKKQSGFTLVELAIIVAIISIMLALAFAGFDQARRNANEASAQQTLRRIARAELMFKSQGVADADKDGVGEYGTLLDLVHNNILGHPYIEDVFVEGADHTFSRQGYKFVVELGFNGDSVDDHEKYWVARASPDDKESPTFTIDTIGIVKNEE